MRTLTGLFAGLWISLAACGTPPDEDSEESRGIEEAEVAQDLGPAQPNRPPAVCPDIILTCFNNDVCSSVCGRPSVCNTITSCCVCAVD